MNSQHRFQILIIVAVSAVLLAGCGGDDPAVEESDTTGETTPTEAETDGTAETDDGDDSVDGNEFAELASKGFASQMRVTYELHQEQEGETMETLVVSSDGEQTAWLMPEGRMIARADGSSVFCDEGGQQAQCFEMRGAGQGQGGPMMGAFPFMGLATAFQEGVENFPGFTSSGSEEIAGRTARCGTFDAGRFATGENAGDGEATLCLDEETGVMLKYEARDLEGTVGGIEAVEVGEPEASDFEPPAEPMRMNQGG